VTATRRLTGEAAATRRQIRSNAAETLRIIPLKSDDLAAAHAVLVQLRTQVSRELFERVLDERPYEFLVAKQGRRIVAVCGYRFLYTLTRGHHLHVHDLVVDNTLRRSGIGRQLLDHLAELARRDHAAWIFLDAVPEAEGFYAHCGFEAHGARLLKRRL
jgi:ribosomal protein S18 acetylase RimI-like enzyme